MLNFDNIEDLVSYMFENLDNEDESVSVVADKDLALSIIKELLDYNDVILKYANVDDYEYDREYIVTLHDDLDSDSWDIAIEPIYNYEKEMYFGTDGYVLFHEDVNSKAMIDMQNNENIELAGHDWFTIGEEEESDINDDEEETELGEPDNTDLSTKTTEVYRVNGKEVDKETYLKVAEKINHEMNDMFDDDVLDYFRFLRQLCKWRKFCW